MTLRLGDSAPDFTANSTCGVINFHEYLGDSWGILFSHPRDFTPVCTTELAEVARLQPLFAARNVKTLAYSCDSVEDHLVWIGYIEAYADDSSPKDDPPIKVTYPILEGTDRKIAKLYGMLDYTQPVTVDQDCLKCRLNIIHQHDPRTVRSVFFIDPAKKIKCICTYPDWTGRNFHEILRVVDSLQMAPQQGLATPANWKKGDPACILPAIEDEEAEARFGKENITHLFSFFRVTKPLE